MRKILSTLACALLASSAWAQTTANTAPIGQAVSGHNTTAAGVIVVPAACSISIFCSRSQTMALP